MNTVTVPRESKALNDLLKKARNGNVLLRSESGEQFVLAKVSSAQSFYVGDSDDFDEEVKLTRANKKLMKFLDQRGEKAKKANLIPMAEVEKSLGLKKQNKR
ncbi:MAG TPA: hypothetical protein VIN60_04900 [Anaerolineales bacterium]